MWRDDAAKYRALCGVVECVCVGAACVLVGVASDVGRVGVVGGARRCGGVPRMVVCGGVVLGGWVVYVWMGPV